MKRPLAAVSALFMMSAFAACGDSRDVNSPLDTGEAEAQRIRANKASAPEKSLGTIPSGSIGPFIAWRNADHGVAAYISGPMGSIRHLVTWSVGEAKSEQKIALEIPMETNRLRVRELGTKGSSYLGLFTSLEGKGEALSIVPLASDGRAIGKAIQLVATTNLITWFEAVPTVRGAIALWIEETRGGGADVLSLAIERDGTVSGVPARIARNVSAWQVARDPSGAALALVSRPGDTGGEKSDRIDLIRIDENAQAKDAVLVADKQSTMGDIDIVKTPRGYRVAWTDRTGGDLRVLGAEVDMQSRKVEPRVLAEARGGATLIGLAEAKHGSLLLWDERGQKNARTRTIHAAALTRTGTKRDVSFETDAVAPTVQGTNDGWIILSQVNGSPAIVKTTADLESRVSIPTDTSWGPASLAWAMHCFDSTCRYLAAIGGYDPRVAVVDIDPKFTAANAAAAAPRAPDGRELGDPTSFEVGEAVATIVATEVGGNTLVAVLTQSVEDPKKPRSASKIWVYALNDKGALVGQPNLLTERALPIGGIAIAPAEKPSDGAVLAWVAREKGDPEVHLSTVDQNGKRTKDVQLTQSKGDASDVALAAVPGAFMLAWVDGRLGRAEVFATRFTKDLRAMGRAERITQSSGSKSDVALAAVSDGVVVAWSDTRDAEAEGFGDIFLAKLGSKDAKPTLPETRVLATAAHSRTPAFFAHGDVLGLTWIEEGTSPESSAAMIATFSSGLERNDTPARIPIAEPGRPQSISLISREGKVSGLLARTNGNGAVIDVIEGVPTALHATVLSTERGRPTPDTTVVSTPRAVFFAEEGTTASEHRLHHGKLVPIRP